ncbi:NBR1-Ig-like domain-containing protein [Actinomadura rubteroloni]|nr:NBR1-Ig-like domain-containing protein [Actinomadura rubteroloni]
MSGRSGAISHTTLHEATKGNRLPSWGTTVEFVKACGADPAEYRERWEAANRTVRAAGLQTVPSAAPQSDDETPVTAPEPPAEIAVGGPAPGRSRPPRAVTVALAAGAVGAVVLGAAVLSRGAGSGRGPSADPSQAALSAADCPVHASSPPLAPPTHRGDAATFIADITLPDCTPVPGGRSLIKVWRFKNSGTVPWRNYSLRRLGVPQRADQCQTISDVPVKDTAPGKMVDIRTDVLTPRKPGLCYVRFKMVDASGKVAFPGSRPVTFQLVVR